MPNSCHLILLISDFPARTERYQAWLSQDSSTTWSVKNRPWQTPWRSPEDRNVAACVILIENDSPDKGLEWLQSHNQQQNLNPPPAIAIGPEQVATAVQCLKAGAVDYLSTTAIAPDLLIQSLKSAIASASPSSSNFQDIPSTQNPQTPHLPSSLSSATATTKLDSELEIIINSIPAFAAFIDNQQRYRFVNRSYEYYFHCPISDIINQRIQDIVGEANYQKLRPQIEQALAGQEVNFEGQFEQPAGYSRYYNVTYIPKFDASNNVKGFVVHGQDINDRVQTEKALRHSQDRLRMALESAQLGTWDWDIKTDELDWDVRCKAILGLPADADSSLDTFFEILHPDERERVKQAVSAALTPHSDSEYSIDYRIIRANDNVERWLLAKGQVYFQTDGTPQRFIGTVLDITARKQAETTLKQSEERLQMVLEGSDGGYWDWNIVTNDEYLSPQWLAMLGYETGDLPLQYDSWVRLIHPDDCSWVMERLQKHLQDGSIPYQFEYRLLTKAGYWKWIANYGKVVVRNEQGQPLRMAGVHYDISDRKQTEARLHESEDRLRMAIESTQLGTWDWDLGANILIWDARCKAMFGLSPAATVTIETFYAGLHPDDQQRLEQEIAVCFDPEKGGWYNTEYRTIGIEDGVQRWLLARGKAYFDSDGTPQRFVGTVLDISDRKQVEAERERLLEYEKLARQEAEQANRIKDDFLAILSHELRSPLNPILGLTQLLQTQKFDKAKTAEALATIERNAKLQTQLIDDLLDVAKILRGKLVLQKVPVDLAFAIEAALDTVRATAAVKSIDLQATIPPIGRIWGDATRLQQIVWNLLSNAIKFTPPQGQVSIRLEPIDCQAQITVRDTGKGIKPDFLPNLFESFRQEDASTTRQYGGLGLGLAIVHSLVEAHGGTITADSPGEAQGATFTVRFPLFDSQQETRSPKPNAVPDLDLQGIRVLVVDDEPDTRQLLEKVLTVYEAEVCTVTSAVEALSALELWQPDVLVSDIGMPDVDGYSLIEQIRALPPEKGGKIPAIALTAYAREEDRQRAINSGFQQQLTKPLEPQQLVRVVMRLVASLSRR
ncbi:MAG: PAS domain-containing protein [Jaaginema sp. PMC 1078.18]|nr:PAS domain-containing protein [Jaaginema sp. PMC 1078.18]